MTNYELYSKKAFKLLCYDILDKKHKGSLEYKEIKLKVDKILQSTKAKVSGRSFFNMLVLLGVNFDHTCKTFFKNHPAKQLSSTRNMSDKLIAMFGLYLNSRLELSSATGIKDSRLGSILRNGIDEIYAYEVYSLAIAFDIIPSDLFHYFYGDGEMPAMGV